MSLHAELVGHDLSTLKREGKENAEYKEYEVGHYCLRVMSVGVFF
jgi:hypothetical protein